MGGVVQRICILQIFAFQYTLNTPGSPPSLFQVSHACFSITNPFLVCVYVWFMLPRNQKLFSLRPAHIWILKGLVSCPHVYGVHGIGQSIDGPQRDSVHGSPVSLLSILYFIGWMVDYGRTQMSDMVRDKVLLGHIQNSQDLWCSY